MAKSAKELAVIEGGLAVRPKERFGTDKVFEAEFEPERSPG